jgi:hypothetical protein
LFFCHGRTSYGDQSGQTGISLSPIKRQYSSLMLFLFIRGREGGREYEEEKSNLILFVSLPPFANPTLSRLQQSKAESSSMATNQPW